MLRYRSRRRGFVPYVVGQIREVAKLYYDTAITVQVLSAEDGPETENGDETGTGSSQESELYWLYCHRRGFCQHHRTTWICIQDCFKTLPNFDNLIVNQSIVGLIVFNQAYSEYKHVLANILRLRHVARTPPLEARSAGRRSNVENASVTNQQREHTPRKLGFALCCHSNATGAPIANPPNSAQLGGSL